MFIYNNKSVFITGGASGIGKATALLMAQQQAEVYIIDLNENAVQQTVAEIESSGAKATGVVLDVTDQAAVVAAFGQYGQVDVLVNCAGISHIGTATSTTEADFEKVFRVNVKGVYNCLYAALPLMQQKGQGVILNLSSIAGNVGIPDRFAYSMSKGAVLGMTLSVAKDYISQNIRCNCISPARVHTPFVDNFLSKTYPGREAEMYERLSKTQPIGRMAKPEEIAALILYLCSNEAAFITGCDYPIDGGFITLNN